MSELHKTGAWLSGRPGHCRNLPQSQAVAGYGIGILCIPGVTALMPGDIQNATSFDFPVLYHVLEDIEFEQIACGSDEVTPALIAGARQLIANGARAVVGACGSFGHYQKAVADAVNVPVYMSIIAQVPFLQQSLGAQQKLLAVFASGSAYTPLLREQCNIVDTDRLQVISLWETQRFADMSKAEYQMDVDALVDELVEHIADSIDPAVGAIVLQCSNLPPFASAIQQHFGLPVFDMTNLISWLQSAVVRRDFAGYL